MKDSYQMRVVKERAKAAATIRGHRLGKFRTEESIDGFVVYASAKCLGCGLGIIVKSDGSAGFFAGPCSVVQCHEYNGAG